MVFLILQGSCCGVVVGVIVIGNQSWIAEKMSSETPKALMRQWRIIWYLAEGIYVSSANIRDHLASLGIEVEMRTIQRDLLVLSKMIPLECRRDSVPYSWRWKKSEEVPAIGMSLTQALTLRMVEEQLSEVLSPTQMHDLKPLFLKARLVTGIGVDRDLAAEVLRNKNGESGGVFGIAGSLGIMPIFDVFKFFSAHSVIRDSKYHFKKSDDEIMADLFTTLSLNGFSELLQ